MDNIFVFKVSIVKTVIGFALGLRWDCVGNAWIARDRLEITSRLPRDYL